MAGDGPDTPLTEFLRALEDLARRRRDAMGSLDRGEEEDPASDLVDAALQAQFVAWRQAARRAAAVAASAPGRETLARLLDPGQWLFTGCEALDPALRGLIDGASDRADWRDLGRERLREAPEWAALRRARRRHRRLVGAAWSEAFEKLTRAVAADPPLDPLALHRRWTAEAEAALGALHASDRFAESQAALVTAAVALREVEIGLVEAFCEANGLPTRREVDDLHREMAALRAELRALRAG